MCVLSQAAETTLRILGANPKLPSALVVSHHLNGLLRSIKSGCIATRADHGVHCVSRFRRPGPARCFETFPAMRVPLEEFPLSVAGTASLRPLSLLLFLHNFAFHTPNQTLRRALARAEIVGQNGKPRYLLISRASAEAVAHANFVPVRQNVPDLMLPLDESSFPTKLGATRAPLPGMVCVEPLAEASSPALPYQTPTKVSYWCVL